MDAVGIDGARPLADGIETDVGFEQRVHPPLNPARVRQRDPLFACGKATQQHGLEDKVLGADRLQ